MKKLFLRFSGVKSFRKNLLGLYDVANDNAGREQVLHFLLTAMTGDEIFRYDKCRIFQHDLENAHVSVVGCLAFDTGVHFANVDPYWIHFKELQHILDSRLLLWRLVAGKA